MAFMAGWIDTCTDMHVRFTEFKSWLESGCIWFLTVPYGMYYSEYIYTFILLNWSSYLCAMYGVNVSMADLYQHRPLRRVQERCLSTPDT